MACTLCSQLGSQAGSASANQHLILKQCKEVASCGAFNRAAFVAGLAPHLHQMMADHPVQLLQTVQCFCTDSLFGLALLQQLLPAPAQAADMIQKAACSQEVCLDLMQRRRMPGLLQADSPASPLESLLQLLRVLLLFFFDAAAVAAADASTSTVPAAATSGFSIPADDGSASYVAAVLEILQEDAAQHEVSRGKGCMDCTGTHEQDMAGITLLAWLSGLCGTVMSH